MRPEQYRKAVRDVVQHCIYGVDLNPLAVDLCKVALWLEGLNKGRPLNFLDHRIRCGNSLVGCTSELLEMGIPDEAYKAVTGDDKRIAVAYKKRNKEERNRLQAGHVQLAFAEMAAAQGSLANHFSYLDDLEEDSTEEVHRKATSFDEVRRPGTPWYKEWTACNLWTAAFFTPFVAEGAPVPTTETVTYFLAGLGVEDRVVEAANRLAEKKRFFHWHLEFPEVMDKDGFDVVLGNPPFVSGNNISAHLGADLLAFIKTTVKRSGGTTDLSAYFFQKAFTLLRNSGRFGLIATNTISKTDSRETALQTPIDAGGEITFAIPSTRWIGEANLYVAMVVMHKGNWTGKRILAGRQVVHISAFLEDGEAEPLPAELEENRGLASKGVQVLAKGFILESSDAEQLLERDPRNATVVQPYINGEDLNTQFDQSPSRWVINFRMFSLDEAAKYPDCLTIVEHRVRAEHDLQKEAIAGDYWWRHARPRPAFHKAIEGFAQVLAISLTTKHLAFSWVPANWLCSNANGMFAFEDSFHFSVLQSSIHEAWARKYSGALKNDLRYSLTAAFDTFPFPATATEDCTQVGKMYHEFRRQIMLRRKIGLTQVYNLVHASNCDGRDIAELRQLGAVMDRSVLAAYSWSDINLAHDYYGEGADTRFTISPDAKKEVLSRVLDLNLQRTAE